MHEVERMLKFVVEAFIKRITLGLFLKYSLLYFKHKLRGEVAL